MVFFVSLSMLNIFKHFILIFVYLTNHRAETDRKTEFNVNDFVNSPPPSSGIPTPSLVN